MPGWIIRFNVLGNRRAPLPSFAKGYLALCLVLFMLSCPAWSSGQLISKRDNPESLKYELQQLLSKGEAHSQDPAMLRRMASLYLDLGYGLYVDPGKKMGSFQKGAQLAKKALELDESSAYAHFLYAANLGSATELQGVMEGALAIQELKVHVNRTLELDVTFAPAHHMLGRIYEELPWFMGGDEEAAEKYLKQAVLLDKYYVPGHLDLGRWYLKQGLYEEAKKEFSWVLKTAPKEKVWIWERIHRPQAQKFLLQLEGIESDGAVP